MTSIEYTASIDCIIAITKVFLITPPTGLKFFYVLWNSPEMTALNVIPNSTYTIEITTNISNPPDVTYIGNT